MDSPNASQNSGALIAVGERIDHSESSEERKLRELAAAFNRMGSDSDGEAHNAFERARQLVQDLSLSFDAIYRATKETIALRETNARLGKQLRQALQENAKYRSMNIAYKIKLRLAQILRSGFHAVCLSAPLLIIGILFYLGYVRAVGAAILIVPVGLYDISKGLVQRSFGRLIFGSLLLLASVVGFLAASNQDSPVVHQRMAQLIENMNRDHDLGPKTFTIDYPLSHSSLIMTVVGIKDSMKVSVDGIATPLEVTCAKYYEDSLIVPESAVATATPPATPDIFHRTPAATFGPCDLYAQLSGLH